MRKIPKLKINFHGFTEEEWNKTWNKILELVKSENDIELWAKRNSRFACDRNCASCNEDDKIDCITDMKAAIITTLAECEFLHRRVDQLVNIIQILANFNQRSASKQLLELLSNLQKDEEIEMDEEKEKPEEDEKESPLKKNKKLDRIPDYLKQIYEWYSWVLRININNN